MNSSNASVDMVERPPHMPMPNPRFTYSFARPFNRLEDPSHAESAAYTKQATILAANVPTWKPPTSAMDELAYRSPDASAKEYHRHHIKPNNMLIQMFLSSAPSHFVSRALFPCIVSHASRYSIGMLMHVTYLLESCVRSLSIRMAAGKTDRHAVRLRQYAIAPFVPDSAIRVH